MTTTGACAKEHSQRRPHSTGKERDAESGNDYFSARYYASSMGRFLTPDWSAKVEPVPYSKLDDPQTLNLYAYVGNNPFTRIDPDGHECGDSSSSSSACKGSLLEKFKSIFYAKATAGAGAKLELNLTKHIKGGFSAFAGVEKTFTSSGSVTKIKAEAGGGFNLPHVALHPLAGVEKQIETNGKPDSRPAEFYGEDPIHGEVGPSSANPNTISIGVNVPFAEGVSGGGGEVGINVDRAMDFGRAVVDNVRSGASSLLNFLAPNISGGDLRATTMTLPTPATHGEFPSQ